MATWQLLGLLMWIPHFINPVSWIIHITQSSGESSTPLGLIVKPISQRASAYILTSAICWRLWDKTAVEVTAYYGTACVCMLHMSEVLRKKKKKTQLKNKPTKDRNKPLRLTCLTEISSEMQRAVTGRHSATRQLQLVTRPPVTADAVAADARLMHWTLRRLRGSGRVCCAGRVGDSWLTCQTRGSHGGSGSIQSEPAEIGQKFWWFFWMMKYAHF